MVTVNEGSCGVMRGHTTPQLCWLWEGGKAANGAARVFDFSSTDCFDCFEPVICTNLLETYTVHFAIKSRAPTRANAVASLTAMAGRLLAASC